MNKITSRLFKYDTINSFIAKFSYYVAYGNCFSELELTTIF